MNESIKAGDKVLRVECNWRAIAMFLAAKGAEDLGALTKLSPSDYTLLMACCVNEGERLEGRKCDYTAEDFDTMPPYVVTEFLAIFGRQMNPDIRTKKK